MLRTFRIHAEKVAGFGAALTLVLASVAWWMAGPTGVVLAVGLWVGLWVPILAGLLLESSRVRHDEEEALARQGRAFTNLVAVLEPRLPLPPMRGWAASPDLLCWLTSHVLSARPRGVVELGSGASTLCLGYALERAGGEGRLLTLDHDETYADRTRDIVRAHDLAGRVDVFHAPLVEIEGVKPAAAWYDLGGVELPARIDLLFVDGPPRRSGSYARYPALPALAPRLGPSSVVVLDDGFRRSEREIVALWRERFQPRTVELFDEFEKGAWVLAGFSAG